jgi:hypothetical protein
MEEPGADSEEKHEPASDVDAVMVDSLKALDPERPIREGLSRIKYDRRKLELHRAVERCPSRDDG